MIKIFRQIRKTLWHENKFSKYLIYAIGEIILVVIGILIAISINNWNEIRKMNEQEQKHFIKILADLKIDSISIEKTLTAFRNYQDLYYRLYDEIKGNASYDSTIEYGMLRFTPSFNSVLANDQSMVDKVINENVRLNLSEYLRREKNIFVLGIDQFMDLQINMVRPYLTANNISDIDAIFSIPRYENNEPDKMISYNAMKSKFNTPEFAQILYELRAKSAASMQGLNNLKRENKNLQKIVQDALIK